MGNDKADNRVRLYPDGKPHQVEKAQLLGALTAAVCWC